MEEETYTHTKENRVKFLKFFAVLLLVTFAGSAFAQELSESITTSGGLTVRYPAEYEAYEIEPLVVEVSDPSSGLIVAVGDAITEAFGVTAESPLTTIETMRQLLAEDGADIEMGEVEELTLGDRPAFRFAASSEGEQVMVYSFRLADDTLAVGLVQISENGPALEAMIAIAEPVFLSAEYDANNPGTGVGSNMSGDPIEIIELATPDVIEGSDIIPPAGEPLRLDQMPEGLVVFRTNAVIDRPQDWETDETGVVYSSVSFFRSNYMESLLIMDMETLEFDLIKEIYLPIIASLSSDADFDPETLRRDETLPDGRAMQIYSSLSVEDAFGITVLIVVELLPDRWGVVQATNYDMNGDGEAFVAEIIELARSFRFDVTADPRNSYITLEDGSVALMRSFQCFDTDFGLFDEGDSVSGICPAGCDPTIIWGTDVYTNDSGLCTAAAHAGVITLAEGGPITIIREPGRDEYPASTQNGITSEPWGSWGGSFRVERASGEIHLGTP